LKSVQAIDAVGVAGGRDRAWENSTLVRVTREGELVKSKHRGLGKYLREKGLTGLDTETNGKWRLDGYFLRHPRSGTSRSEKPPAGIPSGPG
jgi:hypothetical protein